MASEGFPVPNSTQPFWRTELHEFDSHRTTPDLPTESDIVIIGAGFAGSSLAHFIYEDNPSPPSVTLLEAREACSGATGRNGGHVKPDVYFNVPKYIKKYGVKAAVEVAAYEASQVFAVKELVEKENIDCDFVMTRACDATLDPVMAKDSHEAFIELRKSGVAGLKDVYHAYGKDAEQLSGVKGALACFTFTAGHLWPYKLVLHLLQGAVKRGANLQTHTPVTHVSESPLPDGRWLVTTDRGSIKAKKVLLATNGYTAKIAPQFKDRIVPVRGICSRIVPDKARRTPFLPYTYSIRHGPAMYDYLIPEPTGASLSEVPASSSGRDTSHWYNVADDSKLIEPAKSHFDGLMQRTFFGWEDSGAKVDKLWTGMIASVMGYSSDFMPHVGEVPEKPGQMVLAGFSGHGMPLILRSAKGIVNMLRHGKSFEETGVPEVFRATKKRLESTKNEILEGGHGNVKAKL
ncbi:Gamma-glutamylputrescine oxidoreductase [Apiospora phragmitis]|uniref:Gamma-glutamylputrescine oxidoreductase n=1 Tax=Apiospora phragmitis TaxID=2905665 RepID=A0ABR1SVF3_9PEZI